MIRREDIVDVLLSASPGYRVRWDQFRGSTDFDANLIYVHLGDFADFVVDLLERHELEGMHAIAVGLERLHVEGDEFVKEAATIGLLEGIQNIASNRRVATTGLEEALGVETRRWWNSLRAFWSGRSPYVGADITKR